MSPEALPEGEWKQEVSYEKTRFQVWRNGDQYQLREGEVIVLRYSEKDFHPTKEERPVQKTG